MAWSISISGTDNLVTKADQVALERYIRDEVATLTRNLAKQRGVTVSTAQTTTNTYGTLNHSGSIEK